MKKFLRLVNSGFLLPRIPLRANQLLDLTPLSSPPNPSNHFQPLTKIPAAQHPHHTTRISHLHRLRAPQIHRFR
jgi:hypothetical protein